METFVIELWNINPVVGEAFHAIFHCLSLVTRAEVGRLGFLFILQRYLKNLSSLSPVFSICFVELFYRFIINVAFMGTETASEGSWDV